MMSSFFALANALDNFVEIMPLMSVTKHYWKFNVCGIQTRSGE
jgi:hypothetical protein